MCSSNHSESTGENGTTAALAHARGIRVMMKPHVWISRREQDQWRENLDFPTDEAWRQWHESYRKLLLHYAVLAEEAQMEMLCVGTELSSSVIWFPQFWRDLIAEIRTVFSGELVYAANWHNGFERIEFWDDLDYIGIQAYFPLSDKTDPSLQDLERGWKKHLKQIGAVQRRFRKPVLFTEIGYQSSPTAAARPWESVSRRRRDAEPGTVDAGLQERCYEALFRTVWDLPWFAGTYIWKWFPNHSRAGGPDDNLFTPQNKPAQVTVARWYGTDDSSLSKLESAIRNRKNLKELWEAHEHNPADDDLAAEYTERLLRSRDFAQAIPVIRRRMTYVTDDSIRSYLHYSLGETYRRYGQNRNAVRIWKKGIDEEILKQERVLALLRLGDVLFRSEEYADAVRYIEMLHTYSSSRLNGRDRREFTRSRGYLRISYIKSGREQKGSELLQHQFSRYGSKDNALPDANDDGDVRDINFRGMAELANLCAQHDVFITGAITRMEKTLQAAGNHSDRNYLLSTYAGLLDKNLNYDKAVEVLNIMIDEEDRKDANSGNREVLAILHKKAGNLNQSNAMFTLLEKEARKDWLKLVNLSRTCLDQDVRLQEALGWAEKAVELSGGRRPDVLITYAQLLFTNGDIRNAVDAASKAVELSPFYRYRNDLETYRSALQRASSQ